MEKIIRSPQEVGFIDRVQVTLNRVRRPETPLWRPEVLPRPSVNTSISHPKPLPSKDSCFKAFGPKDPIIYGFWAIVMLREKVQSTVSIIGTTMYGLGKSPNIL